MLFEHYYEGRRPSLGQVKKMAIQALKGGYTKLEISWGENMIELERHANGQVYGYGWIRSIGGQDLADDLTRAGV